MIGVYEKNKLIFSQYGYEKASEFIPKIIKYLTKRYNLDQLIYANGPGAFMGIKISYLSLKTISIIKNIPLFAISAFELNNYKAIRANNNFCFVYENNNINLKKSQAGNFFLPLNLPILKLKKDNLPFYFLNAV